jgi:hypothetical protein
VVAFVELHRTGGHIILHEPKLIIEFRRGDVIFIPSGAVTHENVPISEGEVCYSFTMYTPGGCFVMLGVECRQ